MLESVQLKVELFNSLQTEAISGTSEVSEVLPDQKTNTYTVIILERLTLSLSGWCNRTLHVCLL